MKLLPLLLLAPSFLFGQTHTLSGLVLDDETMQPLPSATIRIAGTSKGTVTNSQGQFRFALPKGNVTLAVSYLGYKSDTLRIVLTENIFKAIRLRQNAIQLAGVTVTDEDPAYEIIRRAIESKKKWMSQLKTFEGQAFNRTQFRTDSSIAAITEAYSVLYWNRDDSLREVVIQQKQTGNLPRGMVSSRVGTVINFNDDQIKQGGFTFLGPTSPNAFDYYDYKLLSTRSMDDFDIYEIQLIAKSTVVPLYKGTISIASRSYAVMEVDVVPNEAFTQPFVTMKNVRYKQLFRLTENKYWLPANYRFEATFLISVMGISFPAFGIERDVVIYDYAINPEFPDSIKRLSKFTVDSSATKYDSTFWTEHDVLPLTAEQDTAYKTLDSTQTLDKKFAPRGATVSVLNFMGSSAGMADIWFNRVEGFHLGASSSVDSIFSNDLTIRGGLGYGFADKEWKYNAGIALHFGSGQSQGTIAGFANIIQTRKIFTINADLYDKHINMPLTIFSGFLINSFTALISKDDVYDYYRSKGISASLTYVPVPSTRISLGAVAEQQLSLYENTSFAWFGKGRSYRPHPQIADGQFNTVRLSTSFNPSGILSFVKDAFTASAYVDHTSPSLGSDFNYTQAYMRLRGKISTMNREELLFPPSLNLLLATGVTSGNLPPQRYFTPTTNLMAFTPLGTLLGAHTREFYGDHFVTASIEHNFRRVLFAPVGSTWLMESNLELVIGGTVSRYWLSSDALRVVTFPAKDTNGWYYEASIGIQNIFDVLRVDVTRRFRSPKDIVISLTVSDFITGFIPEQ
ncbi:MAG: carboxypeptidase-like regulatory domain-containing protein [Ignavibacteriales bacterium]|nr:carboxypeptidase-like regulatory domain-containing protein [Ignavibacteriales bacterium]